MKKTFDLSQYEMPASTKIILKENCESVWIYELSFQTILLYLCASSRSSKFI